MPTTRPRHQVTETPPVARALEVAARRWPHEPPSRRLARLLQLGADAIEREESAESASQRAILADTAGLFDDAFEPGYLTALRAEWPE